MKIISAFSTSWEHSQQKIKILSNRRESHLTEEELHKGCRFGSDSHADVSVVGTHARIISYIDAFHFFPAVLATEAYGMLRPLISHRHILKYCVYRVVIISMQYFVPSREQSGRMCLLGWG